ncbi:hypothetical protein GALMADRAFT_63536 [Galerina marginata CBS 339.88]|uniref:CxC2-like cysteine cluster KDZ transposase-associated domain-containing protein n=1 Tax=Galerina marginata (strain CBS 339.88) TaxID=685588 RepID=A0A067TIF0_GALM3|nr:hypothetical protein GALMADRAFT_63536 [Galerina marginata CBS 339.88]
MPPDPENDDVGEPEEYNDDVFEDRDDTSSDPQTLPRAPLVDMDDNSFISIVDITRIHHLPVVACCCRAPDAELDDDYVKLGLFPTSFQRIRTVFTIQVLNDFRLSNLECKTSAYQYYQKLRRLTCPAFPKAVINRYRKLRRLSRQYRNLKLWKIHGRTPFETPDAPPWLKKLALFCAACPQPGINLPAEWRSYPDYVIRRQFVLDGNFKAEHLNQKNEADDVQLTEADAFMTAAGPYDTHREEAKKHPARYKQVCHQGKRSRGVGCAACARHGCFCIGSLVDFELGEKQSNMDWSVCECFKHANLNGITDVLLIYDIMCQYHVNLFKRITESTHLSLPDAITIVCAIGLFHVHGHKEECLYRFATTYIPGAGIVDGEILETLWSVLNETSRSIRGATTAHRTEVLDDHMGDSNWKKNINMGMFY